MVIFELFLQMDPADIENSLFFENEVECHYEMRNAE